MQIVDTNVGDHGSEPLSNEELGSTPEPVAPQGETKEQAFKRLASYRVQKTLERIRQIGHLSNRAQYDYNETQIAIIEAAIKDELETVMLRFKGGGKDKPLFTL